MRDHSGVGIRFLGLVMVLAMATGCAVGPRRAGEAAPVEDRGPGAGTAKAVPVPPPPPTVEVRPLVPEPAIVTRPAAPDTGSAAPPLDAPGAAGDRPADASATRWAARASNPAVVALLDHAGQYATAGELERAAASLERALRIEPQNAGLWHDLAALRLEQRQYGQAESLAAKSNALAAGDDRLRALNWRLIAQARRSRGAAEAADAAEAQAMVLERGLPGQR